MTHAVIVLLLELTVHIPKLIGTSLTQLHYNDNRNLNCLPAMGYIKIVQHLKIK